MISEVDLNVPQHTDEIQRICSEAQLTMNAGNVTPPEAEEFEIDVAQNDPRLWETIHDGGCLLYTLFYVVYRDPFLKTLFHSAVRRTSDNYFFFVRVLGNAYTFRIPISVIAEEKSANRARIFSTDLEFLNALTVLCFAVMYLKCGFVDRLALQPFLETDVFFDRPFHYVGGWSKFETASLGGFAIVTDLHRLTLGEGGRIAFEDESVLVGHYVLTLGHYGEGARFGHSVVVFFDFGEGLWKFYSNLNDEHERMIGEHPLAEVVPCAFNGVAIISGVGTD
jgi:hypothetical protein